MKELVAIAFLAADVAFGQSPSADTKTFIQPTNTEAFIRVCKQPLTDSAGLASHAYCVGYVAGIADTASDVVLRGDGTYGDVLEATVDWMRARGLSSAPIDKLMPIDGMWVGAAVHEALLALYPRGKIHE
jgi:hypothetical protein